VHLMNRRSIRNVAFAFFAITVAVAGRANAAGGGIITWCQGSEGCNPEFCAAAWGSCYDDGGWEYQGCYEDADPDCGCAYQCYIPN